MSRVERLNQMTKSIKIKTEDGKELREGDRAFNYYDRKVGYIASIDDGPDPWFDFIHDDATYASLNGSRICSIEFATKKGWI